MCTYEFPLSLEQGNGVATEDSTMGLMESPWSRAVAAHPGTWAVRAGIASVPAGRKVGIFLGSLATVELPACVLLAVSPQPRAQEATALLPMAASWGRGKDSWQAAVLG